MKRFWKIIFVIALMATLSACAAPASGSTSSSSGSSQPAQTTPQPGLNADAGQMPLETRLALGILQLEEGNLAVTPQQAQTLLPLWKAVKSLSSSDTASAEEIQALYEQIQEALTAEQLQQIQNLSLTQDDLRTLMEKYGIASNFPADAAGGLTQEQIATRVAQRGESGFPGGGAGGGGFPPDGGMGGGMPPAFAGGSGQQVTPDPTRMAQRRGLGMNRLFLDPLIQLLESRAAES
ncbi:MAG: hypothetical protein AB1457_12635 [Chloroflexota bacterium]|nr:MAG: hypothetical protein KatS3mg045_1190 [Bellilinea sp.]